MSYLLFVVWTVTVGFVFYRTGYRSGFSKGVGDASLLWPNSSD